MNRRELLHSAGWLVGGAWLGKLLPAGNQPDPQTDDPDVVTAADLARMEASAARDWYPLTHARLHYAGAIQFNADQIAFYGYGPPEAAAADRLRAERFAGEDLLDSGTSPCGRGWCVWVRCVLSEALRQELREDAGRREGRQRRAEIRAERKAGAILAEKPPNRSRGVKIAKPTKEADTMSVSLANLGISPKQSERWQSEASVPDQVESGE